MILKKSLKCSDCKTILLRLLKTQGTMNLGQPPPVATAQNDQPPNTYVRIMDYLSSLLSLDISCPRHYKQRSWKGWRTWNVEASNVFPFHLGRQRYKKKSSSKSQQAIPNRFAAWTPSRLRWRRPCRLCQKNPCPVVFLCGTRPKSLADLQGCAAFPESKSPMELLLLIIS